MKNGLNEPKTRISLLPRHTQLFLIKLGYFWIKIDHTADSLLKLQIKIGVHLINAKLTQLLTLAKGNYVYESNGQGIKISPPWASLGYGSRGFPFNCIGLKVNKNSDRGTLADLRCSAYHSMYSICEL